MPDARLPSTSGVRHAVVAVLGFSYAVVLGFVVFWPSPIDAPVEGLLSRAIEELHERGVPTFVDYGFIEFTANIVMFVPVGLLLGLALPKRAAWTALLLGPAISAAIEYMQGILLDARISSVWDVAANSIGTTVGVLIALTIRGLVSARDGAVIRRTRGGGRHSAVY